MSFLTRPFRSLFKQRALARLYAPYVHPGTLVFDVGANRGERTRAFLRLGASVVAIEPQPVLANFLQKQFSRKSLQVVQAALGASTGMADLRLCQESDECASLSPEFVQTFSHISSLHFPSTLSVPVLTLDQLIEKYGKPQLIKLDVEGFESEVLRGLSQPINFIHLEFNRPLLADTKKALERAAALGPYLCNFLAFERFQKVLPNDLPIAAFQEKIHDFLPASLLTGEILLTLK